MSILENPKSIFLDFVQSLRSGVVFDIDKDIQALYNEALHNMPSYELQGLFAYNDQSISRLILDALNKLQTIIFNQTKQKIQLYRATYKDNQPQWEIQTIENFQFVKKLSEEQNIDLHDTELESLFFFLDELMINKHVTEKDIGMKKTNRKENQVCEVLQHLQVLYPDFLIGQKCLWKQKTQYLQLSMVQKVIKINKNNQFITQIYQLWALCMIVFVNFEQRVLEFLYPRMYAQQEELLLQQKNVSPQKEEQPLVTYLERIEIDNFQVSYTPIEFPRAEYLFPKSIEDYNIIEAFKLLD